MPLLPDCWRGLVPVYTLQVLMSAVAPTNNVCLCRPRGRNGPAASPNSLPGSGGRSLEECRAAAAGLLEGSGVPELEERVLGFLCEAAAGVKLMATLDDTGRLLAEVGRSAAFQQFSFYKICEHPQFYCAINGLGRGRWCARTGREGPGLFM